MRNLRRHLTEIRAQLSPQKHVLILMDFDGTLSPLATAPEKAHLPQNVQRMLLQLASQPRVCVAILSGRPLGYLKSVFGAPSFFYGGNHGLEMEGPDFSFCHPGARALKTAIQNLVRRFRKPIEGVPGALLENKELSLAIHYRNVPRANRPDFDALVEKLRNKTAGLPIRWQPGNKVWELLPQVAWNKGRAAKALIQHLEHPFPVAVGDDKTDEDMFKALPKKGITVHVGSDGDSCAQFCLMRQSEIPWFLRFLEGVLK